jgi:predicted nucleotidyltransferase
VADSGSSPSIAAAVLHFRTKAELEHAGREQRAELLQQVARGAVETQLPPGARAWLIGSLVWGGFAERSDVDLVLDGVDGPGATQIESVLANATGLPVDVLHLERLPDSFQRRVLEEGIAIHGS